MQHSFQPGNPGRPRGVRNRISSRLLQIVFDHSQEPAKPGSERTKFMASLEVMFKEKPVEYAKMLASLLPKQVDISDPAVADLDMEQTDTLIAQLKQRALAPVVALDASNV